MHNCQEFRERITEHIIDREDIASRAAFHNELVLCAHCADFYAQAREMMDALSGIDLSISEAQWMGIERRLHARIECVEPERRFLPFRIFRSEVLQSWNLRFAGFLLGAVALVFVTVTLSRVPPPAVEAPAPAEISGPFYWEQSVPLDPVTIDFLEQSELLLRNVMNMAPMDADDLADAKKTASEQLAELAQRKEAAAEVPPVVSVMETYETILRDLRNVDEHGADEDISDIQTRIRRNGLIANMKSFQPRVTEIGFGLR